MSIGTWHGIGSEIGEYVSDESQRALQAYEIKPDLVLEHANIEQSVSQGGYGRKQLNELIQNAADALRDTGGRISIILTADSLYCANEGTAFTQDGFRTLLLSHTSHKRDDQIGRFGLGFKSVLPITDNPQIFSRSGSVGWSSTHSRQMLDSIYPGLATYPLLRLAQPLDPYAEASQDDVLTELMIWATTVVKLPLRDNLFWLQEELRKFPHHFLLFSPHIHELHLEDRISGSSVTWKSKEHNAHIELSNGTTSEDWLLFNHRHKVSSAAAIDAGTIFAREEVDVAWAVPLSVGNKRELGTVWNYFPTEHRLSLRGIVNAAFKMNEDRVNMLENLYNKEILEKAVPRMVAGALSFLSTSQDPSAHFDILPSRQKESRSWADKVLNSPVMQIVAAVPCLPDLNGELRDIASLNVQPDFTDYPDLVDTWMSVPNKEPNWVHNSAFSHRDRTAMLTRLLEISQKRRATTATWLEAVVVNPSLPNYEAALKLAAYIDNHVPEHMQDMRRSRILLMADGSVVEPRRDLVSLPSHAEDSEKDLIDYEMMHFGNSLISLKSLGFEVFNGTGRLKKVARDVAENYEDPVRAESLWRLSRSFTISESYKVIDELLEIDRVLVFKKNGEWTPFSSAWLPGKLLRAERLEDAKVIVDPQFHGKDLPLFRQFGMQGSLSSPAMKSSGATFSFWKKSESERLSAASIHSPQPVSNTAVKFPSVLLTPRLEELAQVSEMSRAAVTAQLAVTDQPSVTVEYTTALKSPEKLDSPDIWWVRRFGVIVTPLGLVDTKYCVGEISGFPEAFLPTADPEISRKLSLPTNPLDVNWDFVLPLAESKLKLQQVHELYGLMAFTGVRAPKKLLVESSPGNFTRYPTHMVQLAEDATTHDYLSRNPQHASIKTGHAELDNALNESWKLTSCRVTFTDTPQFVENISEKTELSEEKFTGLRSVTGIKPILCVPCDSIKIIRSSDFDDTETSTELSIFRDPETNKLYHLSTLTPRKLLTEMLALFGVKKDVSEVERRRKEYLAALKEKKLKDQVKKTKDPAEKLSLLVGSDAIQSLIPAAVVAMLSAQNIELTNKLRFEIVSNLYGANLMSHLQHALRDQGIENPEDFNGKSKQAKELLKDLGFSQDLIGTTLPRKPDREEIVGPVRLSPLHDYQESTSRKIKALLSSETLNSKGVVQLPTGAGKTRVAAQSVIEHVAAAEVPQLVVWIAHSEELCEQAIESWTTTWQAFGAPGERMAVSRLWGGRPAKQETTKLHLVVTTIQTLTRIADDVAAKAPRGLQYDWLSDPSIVIIDEAHGAIASSYTPVLKWFKRSTRESGKPLLGLSATPYRGTNALETERLVNRFQANLIEPDEFSVDTAHTYLQNMGVLAKVRHEMLEGIRLEQRHTKGHALLDDDSPNAMLEQRVDLEQVAKSSERNTKIIGHLVENRGSIKHALVFAASVEHAEALAAVLTATGVPSAALSSKTPSSQRRALIERFRSGDIQVLTNFDILSQGFDAPKVDAVYMCRPTFSPNKYIQMVGRGLRGSANGGSDEVLIVNIQDNLEQFGTELAYTEFNYLWSRESKDGN
ncbi:UNVERIFIED_CONTAM: DEAD/DEAH box helicase family protein [Actinomycetes bacterium ARC8]|nr:DEAD/DEAH box helicase family protein [Actinomycetes bacterium ARC8]